MMKKRILTIITALSVLCSSIIPGMEAGAKETAQTSGGTVYYVSTRNGKDRNDGKSQNTPFYSLQKINELTLAPGDQVLLERGSVFTDGYLHLYGQSGSEEAPIVVDAYGEGAAPVIDTNGQGIWYQNYGYRLDNTDHKYRGYVSSSVLLFDTEYIEIKNLEIVNRAPDIENVYNEIDVMNRTGVAAVAQDKGTLEHIYLDGLNVHDVIGNVYDKHMNNGGIYFTVALPHDAKEENGEFVSKTGISRYHDVKIENCIVNNVNRWGIAVGYTAYWEKVSGQAISDEDIQTYGSTNVVVRNNYVKDAGGDAITMMYCDRPLVEYNVSDGVARQINTTDYCNNNNAAGTRIVGNVAAAIWPWKCKDAVFQYNEAFDTRNGDAGNDDAQAWDADSGDGTLYQYNYSHNNSGGCVMFCLGEAYRNTFRYNISQNDLKGAVDIAGNPDAHIYNNVFYMKENTPFIRQRTNGGNMVAENNIIYYSGDQPMQDTWMKKGTIDLSYSNNLYYNYEEAPADDAYAVEVSKGTQVLKDAGSAPASAEQTVRRHEDPTVRSAFDGYRLTENSPAIGKGKVIEDQNGKELCKTDFFGNEISPTETPDIGVHKYRADQKEPLPPSVQKPTAADPGEHSVTIRWPAVEDFSGVTGYKIKSGDVVLMDIENPKEVTDSATGMITVLLENLEPGKTYTLSIVAYDADGIESKPQNFVFQTAGNPKEDGKPGDKNPPGNSGGPDKDVRKGSIKLNQTSATIYTKGVTSVVLKAELSNITGAVSWSSSDQNVATVSNGKVTAKKAGTATITAKAGGYQASCVITVKKPSLQVKKSITVKKGKKAKLKVTAVPKGKITYGIKGKKIIKISKKGVIKGLKKGRCKIVVKCNGVKKNVTVKVK